MPILAETVAVVAGTSSLGWKRFLFAAFAGSVPAAALYAATGATTTALDHLLLVFALVLLVAGVFWLVGRKIIGPAGSTKPNPADKEERRG